jgi:hypothetical protein
MSHVFGFAELVKHFSASMHERKTTFESFRVEPDLSQGDNLSARPSRRNQDARPWPKIAVQKGRFPIEEAAQIVLGRRIELRLVKVLRRNGI